VLIVEPPERDYMARPILEDLRRTGVAVERVNAFAEARLEAVQALVSPVCSAEVMARAPDLRAIVNPYTGSEHIDRAEATRRGIVVGIGQTQENVAGMAEATILLLLDAFYDLKRAEQVLRQGDRRPAIQARQLAGKTVGLLGFGRIAQAVAERLAGWGVELLVSAPRAPAFPPYVASAALEELLQRSDAVLVLCSLNESTHNLLNRERLAQMKPGAVLVNTARGGIVDEAALCEAARSGRIGRLALDAFSIEPLPLDSPLRTLPNAVLTPHMIGHTIEGEQSMQRTAADSVRRVLAGAPPVHTLNPEVLPSWMARHAPPTAESPGPRST
jgi:D-3-phosphoglycerate dehydrogenase